MSLELKECGINYAELGWTIVPVNGKHPLIPWKDLKETTPENVEAWFKQFGSKITGFALKTGYVEGVFVLDLESDEDPSRFELPETVRARSGGGGMHYYFNSVGNLQEAGSINLRRYGISGDFRGDGALIVLPPSIHPKTGKSYEWEIELDIDLLANAPDWLCQIVSENQNGKVDWNLVVAEPVEKGSRHNVATSVAGKILHHFPPDDWDSIGYTLLNSWNNTQCVEPLSQTEIDSIYHGLQKKQISQTKSKEKHNLPRKPLTIGELYELSESQRPEFLVEGIIPENSITVIGGHPGSGKSWIMLEIARAVSTGTKFVNEFESKQKTVLVVDEENGFWEMRRRLESLGFSKESALHFCCQYEFKLDDEESLEELLGICREQSIGLIILDPLANLHNKDENSAKEMQVVLSALQKFNQIGVTVIFIHHHRKGVLGASGQNLRGSSAIHGRADSILVVEKSGTDEPLTMTVKHVKSRKGKPSDTSQIILLEDSSTPPIKLLYGGHAPTNTLKKNSAKEYILKLLESGEMMRKEIIEAVQSEEDIGERNIIGALSELENEKTITSKRINREKQYCLISL